MKSMNKHVQKKRTLNVDYFQSAMFGVNDALVSTTGVIVGMSAGTGDKKVIVLAGIVTILVEALSMGAGEYLSDKSAHQLSGDNSLRVPIMSGVVMFISYLLGGLVPLIPVLILPVSISWLVAIVAALVGLFALGYAKGRITGLSPLKGAVEVAIIGGAATAIGLVAGLIIGS